MFCAATLTAVPYRRSTTAVSAVNGAQITTSDCVAAICGSSASTNSPASATVLCIFQLAAMYGVLGIAQGLHARQLLSLQELQGCSSSSREPVNFVGKAELLQRCNRVAASD